jgi:lipid A 3-O-deacylase
VKRMFTILAVLALALAGAVGAGPEEEHDFLTIGTGWYDFNDNKDAVDFRVEYRSDLKLLGFIKPWAGIEFTSDRAVYGVAGIHTDIFFGRRIVLTPSFGVGAYADGDGKDLGNTIEFRSQIELGYRFDDWSRLSLAVSHISNASLGDNNPGTEIATIYYHIPIRNLTGD